jgi:hypothetical protein
MGAEARKVALSEFGWEQTGDRLWAALESALEAFRGERLPQGHQRGHVTVGED